jgi:hypothetical protein
MLAGRPHEAASNGSPRWMAAGPRSRGCTEPGLQAGSPAAYASDLPCNDAQESAGAFGGTRTSRRTPCQARPGPGRWPWDQVPLQVHSGGDRLVAKPTGHLGDGPAFGQRSTGERMPQIMKRDVPGDLGSLYRWFPDFAVEVGSSRHSPPAGGYWGKKARQLEDWRAFLRAGYGNVQTQMS